MAFASGTILEKVVTLLVFFWGNPKTILHPQEILVSLSESLDDGTPCLKVMMMIMIMMMIVGEQAWRQPKQTKKGRKGPEVLSSFRNATGVIKTLAPDLEGLQEALQRGVKVRQSDHTFVAKQYTAWPKPK